MKFLLAIAVMFAMLQPPMLLACDMAPSDEAVHHAMDGEADEPMAGHDCCDPEPEEPAADCMDSASCGGCLMSLTVVPPSGESLPHLAAHHHLALAASGLAEPHTHPPFRPPIT